MMSGTFLIEFAYSVRETDATFIAHRLIGGNDREKGRMSPAGTTEFSSSVPDGTRELMGTVPSDESLG
jgi:hypothetical protein